LAYKVRINENFAFADKWPFIIIIYHLLNSFHKSWNNYYRPFSKNEWNEHFSSFFQFNK
jgi:hypothetical protein